MNIRACSTLQDDDLGEGLHLVSREILLYKDKDTGEVFSTWDNPWTGETVDVLHVANDPVNFKMYETGRDGSPLQWNGEDRRGRHLVDAQHRAALVSKPAWRRLPERDWRHLSRH